MAFGHIFNDSPAQFFYPYSCPMLIIPSGFHRKGNLSDQKGTRPHSDCSGPQPSGAPRNLPRAPAVLAPQTCQLPGSGPWRAEALTALSPRPLLAPRTGSASHLYIAETPLKTVRQGTLSPQFAHLDILVPVQSPSCHTLAQVSSLVSSF